MAAVVVTCDIVRAVLAIIHCGWVCERFARNIIFMPGRGYLDWCIERSTIEPII